MAAGQAMTALPRITGARDRTATWTGRSQPALSVPCCEQDPDLWFSESPSHLEVAKAYCRACPLVTSCLAGARARREPWGVWGGEIFDRGEVVAVKRGRGRPRSALRRLAG